MSKEKEDDYLFYAFNCPHCDKLIRIEMKVNKK